MVADVQPFKEEPYGWCVVFSVSMIHIIVDGLTYSFGALYPELLVHFNATALSTSIVMSILVGVTYGCEFSLKSQRNWHVHYDANAAEAFSFFLFHVDLWPVLCLASLVQELSL
jgi:hypothetical protein